MFIIIGFISSFPAIYIINSFKEDNSYYLVKSIKPQSFNIVNDNTINYKEDNNEYLLENLESIKDKTKGNEKKDNEYYVIEIYKSNDVSKVVIDYRS